MSGAPGPDLSRLRGAKTHPEIPDEKTAPTAGRGGVPPLGRPALPMERKRSDTTPRPIRERRRDDAQVTSLKRLGRLVGNDPKTATRILGKGRVVSTATDAAVRTAVSVSASIGCGWNPGCGFWDPFNRGWNGCPPWWNWWGSPRWCWSWASCSCPWWGWGWGFGFHSSNFAFWWSGGPWYDAPAYYSPAPVYYSTVIYDTYDPPPAREIVYVEQPPAQYPSQPVAAPAAEGEGSIQVAAPSQAAQPEAKDGQGAMQSAASHHLTLGDQAFREGRYSDAVHYYAKAVELAPGEGVLHLILSDALFATGDYHYAAYALRRALELDPMLVDSVVDKHSFYGDPSEFDRQIDLLERYMEDHFLDDDARLLLAANYLFGAKPSQAVDLLQSPFSVAVRDSGAGKVLIERAKKVLEEKMLKGEPGK